MFVIWLIIFFSINSLVITRFSTKITNKQIHIYLFKPDLFNVMLFFFADTECLNDLFLLANF